MMDRENRKAMEHYLPKYTKIARTPDPLVAYWDDTREIKPIVIEYVELKTSDIISAFCRLQNEAMHNTTKELNQIRREEAIARIKKMTYFYDKVREFKAHNAHRRAY